MEIKTSHSMQNIEITPSGLQDLVARKANITLLDVRTHKEVEIATLATHCEF
jgi:rhodanese-related sulfurtransferase